MRRVVPLLVLCSLAFAPVPPYRPERDSRLIDLPRFQGLWRVKGHYHWRKGVKNDYPWTITHIHIENDTWSLLEQREVVARHRIEIHNQQKPAHLDWRGSQNELLWSGIIRREADRVDIVYLNEANRPDSFETPRDGSTMIVLERVK